MEEIQAINLIAFNPEIRSGRAVVAGTGVCVLDIVMIKLFQNQDVDGLASWFDLTLAQVHAALAYYYQNKTALDLEIREQLAKAQEFEAKRIGSRTLEF